MQSYLNLFFNLIDYILDLFRTTEEDKPSNRIVITYKRYD